MSARAFLFVATALAFPRAAVPMPDPFGVAPPVVQLGPPRIPSDPDRWLPWRLFTWRDGVKPGAPGLAADPQGYVWAGTPDGPVRYDGQAWQRFDPPADLQPIQTYSMLASRDGSIWLGTQDGRLLRRRRDGTWSRYDRGSGLPAGLVETLAESVEGDRSTVWAGTSTGLAQCRGEVCSEVALRGITVRSLVPSRTAPSRGPDGGLALWIGTSAACGRPAAR